MKRIYYQDGPPSIAAGDAGRFTRGEARPVSDQLARSLLSRTDIRFFEAGKDTPRAEDSEALEAAALEQDRRDAEEAKRLAAEKKKAVEATQPKEKE